MSDRLPADLGTGEIVSGHHLTPVVDVATFINERFGEALAGGRANSCPEEVGTPGFDSELRLGYGYKSKDV